MLKDVATPAEDRLKGFAWTYRSGDLEAGFLTAEKRTQDAADAAISLRGDAAADYWARLETLEAFLPAAQVLMMLTQRAIESALGDRLWEIPYAQS